MRNRFIKTFLALSAVFSFSAGLYSCGGESSSVVSESSENSGHLHPLTHVEALEPTCRVDGHIEYWYCEACNRYYADENGTERIEEEDTIIPAIGEHTYDPDSITWEWDGYTSATATFYCVNNDSKTTRKAAITYAVETEETCTEAGVGIYTATAMFLGESFTDTKTVVIEAGHDWDTSNLSWAWEGYESAVVTFTCTRDPSHTVSLDASISSSVTTEPSCETEGVRTYVAEATFQGVIYSSTQTEAIEPTGHTLTHVGRTEAACYENGNTEYWCCEECGTLFSDEEGINEISTEDTVIYPTHSFGTDGYCTQCGIHEPTEGISYSYDSSTKTYSVAGIGDATDTDLYFADRYDDGTNGNRKVTSIAASAFSGETSITSVTLHDGITSVGNSAFYKCTGLSSVDLGSGVTSIGDNGFNNCTALTTLTVSKSLTSLGEDAFYICWKLSSVYYNGGTVSDWASISFSNDYANPLRYADSLYIDGVLLEEATIDGKAISNYAFYNYSTLTSLTIGDSVISIGNYAFAYCDLIKTVTISSSVTSIGRYVFNGCTALTSVTFEKTTGWYVSTSSSATSGTNLTLTDESTNATYLTDTYAKYYWFRK